MNKLPLPVNRIIEINKNKGMLYSGTSNFAIGTYQKTFMDCFGFTMTWTGQVDTNGYYLYKHFKMIPDVEYHLTY